MRVLRKFYSACAASFVALAVACCFYLQSANAEPVFPPKFTKLYLSIAFSGRTTLLKPIGAPRIAVHCSAKSCDEFLADLASVMPTGSKIIISNAEPTPVLINIFISESDNNTFAARFAIDPGWRTSTYNFPECSTVSFALKDEVKLIAIRAVTTAGRRKNLACLYTEILRASGFPSRELYPQYSTIYEGMSEQSFAQAVNGFKNTMAIHYSPKLQPGMTLSTAEVALQEK
jgi:hypothetical protein